MKALVLDADRRTANVKTVPDPRPAPNELLVRVEAIALNPVDSLYVFNPLGTTGRVIGSDFAGVVHALGDAVPPTSGLKLGDGVAGLLQGACSVNERPGAFSDYLVCPWDLVWKVGRGTRLQEAAAISLCGLTAAQALFFRLGLEAPFQRLTTTTPVLNAREEEEHRQEEPRKKNLSFFINGASTSVGMYAAQLVRRSAESRAGTTVDLFGTASPKHFNMLKAEPYCYTDLVDYRDPDWPAKILGLTMGTGVDYAYDCISEGSTVADSAETLAPGGNMAVVRSREGGAWTARDALAVEPSYGAVWEGLGEDVQYQGMMLPASRAARDFAVCFYRWLSEGGALEANPLREMPGGLERVVEDGLRLLGSGTMGDRDYASGLDWMRRLSAEKMVYSLKGE